MLLCFLACGADCMRNQTGLCSVSALPETISPAYFTFCPGDASRSVHMNAYKEDAVATALLFYALGVPPTLPRYLWKEKNQSQRRSPGTTATWTRTALPYVDVRV